MPSSQSNYNMPSLLLLLMTLSLFPCAYCKTTCRTCPDRSCQSNDTCQGDMCMVMFHANILGNQYLRGCVNSSPATPEITGWECHSMEYANSFTSVCVCSGDMCNADEFRIADRSYGPITCSMGLDRHCRGDICVLHLNNDRRGCLKDSGSLAHSVFPLMHIANSKRSRHGQLCTVFSGEEICLCTTDHCNQVAPSTLSIAKSSHVNCYNCQPGDKCHNQTCSGSACFVSVERFNGKTSMQRGCIAHGATEQQYMQYAMAHLHFEMSICRRSFCNADMLTSVSAMNQGFSLHPSTIVNMLLAVVPFIWVCC